MMALRFSVVSVGAFLVTALLVGCANFAPNPQKPTNPRAIAPDRFSESPSSAATQPSTSGPNEERASGPSEADHQVVTAKSDLPVTAPLENPFVPVNMSVNPGDWVTPAEAGMLEYLRDRVVSSGTFAAVSPGVQRWPVTLELRFEHKPQSVVADTAAGLLGGGTLLLVPTGSVHDYVLKADLWAGYQTIERREYRIERTRIMWLFKSPLKADHPAIDQLIELMKADFVARPPLPTLREARAQPIARESM